MINIPANVILIWLGAAADIPTGFTRVTALDGKYPKGADADNAGDTGGNATHTHTSPAHVHTLPAHQHTYTITGITNFQDENRDNLASGENVQANHSHNGITDNSAPGDTSAVTVTYGAASNDPNYITAIFIKGDGAHPLPDGAIMLQGNPTLPANFTIPGAPKNKFLKGAAAAADGGVAGGGTANTHSINHSHSGYAHDHGTTTSSWVLDGTWRNSNGWVMCGNHRHTFTPTTTEATIDDFVGTLTPPETVEPAYKKLLAVQKGTGGDLVSGLIGMWLGAIADIPAGWYLCDGVVNALDLKGFHLKIANDTTEPGAVGGANTHTHAAQSHSHTTPSHTHFQPELFHTSRGFDCPNGQAFDGLYSYQHHPGFYLDPASPAYAPSITTADSSNNEPAYKKVHFIMFGKKYNTLTVPLAYKVKINRQITKPFAYKIHKRSTIVLPMEYAIRTINWELIPKPEL